MTDFARLVLDADTKGLKGAERDLKSMAGQAGRTASEVGKSMQKLGLGLTAGVTAPLGFFAKGAAQAAIDAQEMESAFDVVFGNMASSVRAWSEETGNALGRSTQEIQRGALAFQELFGKALDPGQAAEMSKQFAVLTQDLASFKNLSNEVAQQKLFSGLVGEAEPLRAVGVFINEAAVSAKALELGIGAANGKLTDQEKIIARAALIQEQLAAAQGDVLRTSDSTANQIKRSQAAFEELQIVIGTKLLPILTPLIEKLGAALEWFTSLPSPVQDTILVVAGLGAALGPVLGALGSIITIAPAIAAAFGVVKVAALGLMANPVILGFAAVLAGIYLAWQNWDTIVDVVSRLYTGVKTWLMDKLGAVFNWLRDKIKAVTGFFFDMYDAVVGNSYVPDMVEGIGSEFGRLQALMVDPARKAAGDVKSIMAGMAADVAGMQVPKTMDRLNSNNDRLAAIGGRPLDEIEELEKAANRWADAQDALKAKTEATTVTIAESFGQMADRTLQALDRMVGAIRGGGFLDILGSVLNFGLQLGGMGVFGKSVQANINKPPSFDGGGYTGNGARTGGLDGKGGFLAMMHPRETVTDHTRGGGGSTHVTVGIDPRSGNLTAFVDGRAAQMVPVAANAGAGLAQAQMAQRQQRRIR